MSSGWPPARALRPAHRAWVVGAVVLALLLASTSRAHARGDVALRAGITYTPSGWPQALQADLYVPSDAGALRPAVVVVHGGGWNGRDREDMTGISEQLAQHGFVTLNIDYRLAPRFRHPAPVDDVRAAVTYLRQNAAALRLDPARIGGWGYSAGAQLVTLASNQEQGAVPLMRAVVAGAMPADFRRYPQSPVIAEYIGASYAEAQSTWESASPLLQVSSGDPPMFLYQGNGDRIVQPEELTSMQAALQRRGVPVEVHRVPLLGHIATFLFSRESRRAGIDFLSRYLKANG